eukprot:m.61456 g.61456  ORF g.61456 m.61456 type:complete len:230 (-) comp7082_c0_seq1:191-880(-)
MGWDYHAAWAAAVRRAWLVQETAAALVAECPPCTFALVALTLFVSMLVHYRFVRPTALSLSTERMVSHLEIWRAVLSVFWHEARGPSMLAHTLLLYHSLSRLETQYFSGPDFLYMLILLWGATLALGSAFELRSLATSFAAALLLVYSFAFPQRTVSVLLDLRMPVPLLPYALIAAKLISSQGILAELLGYAAGLAYWKAKFDYPHALGIDALATPAIVADLARALGVV